MATYKGKDVTVNGTPQQISQKFADLTVLEPALDRLPDAERQKIGDISFTPDAIIMNNPQTGQIKFVVSERTDHRIAMTCQGGPLPISMDITLKAINDTDTLMSTGLELDIPLFLRPVVGPYLSKALDQITDLLANIAKA